MTQKQKTTYRKVDTRIWNDAKFNRLSDHGKLAFLMMLTHPNMTALGAMRGTVEGLTAEMGWRSEGLREAFQEAFAEGMAEACPEGPLIALPNFLKYNRPESPNVIKAWAKAWEILPECWLKNVVAQRAEALSKDLSKGFRKAFVEAFPKDYAYTENREQRAENKKSTTSPEGLQEKNYPLDKHSPPVRSVS